MDDGNAPGPLVLGKPPPCAERLIVLTEVSFSGLGIAEPIERALTAENYTTPTPIQTQAIPSLIDGRDFLGLAQTGTGKTAAFTCPLLQRLTVDRRHAGPRACRALILAPTRELAIQIGESIRVYSRYVSVRHTVITGGVSQGRQVQAMARGVDILVATPGRLLDLIGQGHVALHSVRTLVLDEADRMLDMGFIRDIRKIVAWLPKQRQTMLFSATMPAEIEELARAILVDPVKVAVTPENVTVDRIEQRLFHVPTSAKRALLETLLEDPSMARVIVFTRTKHGANRLAGQLVRSGINADAIHGNKSQAARQRALENFRDNAARVLVATDIAARGLDVDGISHVVNYDLPVEAESYVHRIGRTARAGASGIAYSFCDSSERKYLREIERLVKRPLEMAEAPDGLAMSCEPGNADGEQRRSSTPTRSRRNTSKRNTTAGEQRPLKPHFSRSRRRRGRARNAKKVA